MNGIAQWWADSRGKVIAVLLILWLGSLHFTAPLLALFGMLIADSIVSRHITLSTIVTGLLIGLVFDPGAGITAVLAACFLASLSKNFIGKGPHNHIFNPAAFGILVSSLIFNRPVSWWGASWGIVPVLILAIGMAPALWPFRRIWMPVIFLLIYFLTVGRITLDGTVFLFAFVMLPEPKTAPKIGLWQYGWGILVGGLVLLETVFKISFTDPLLLALLAANFVGFFLKRYTFTR